MLYGVALITGAGGTGIGAAVARAFVSAGCRRLVVTDINPSALQSTVDAAKGLAKGEKLDVLSVSGDISSANFVDDLFDQAKSRFGRLDYAVNCAGILSNGKPSDESSAEDFDRINNVNYRGLWLCSRKELALMKSQKIEEREGFEGLRSQRGSIINIASQLASVGRPGAAIYCASKSAILSLTRCDAIDASPWKIRVNTVSPGWIDTPMTQVINNAPPPTYTTPEGEAIQANTLAAADAINLSPMRRAGKPEEIADACVFISSERASFVQGSNFTVDGGYTIN